MRNHNTMQVDNFLTWMDGVTGLGGTGRPEKIDVNVEFG